MQFNTNPETGIRYTVYSSHSIDSDLMQDLWFTHGKNIDEEYAMQQAYLDARSEAQDAAVEAGETFDEDEFEAEWECPDLQIDEPTIRGLYEGVDYMISWLGGAPLLHIFDSPYRFFGNLCSPCIPNAVNFDSGPGPYEGYGVPPDWLAVRSTSSERRCRDESI